eukprot:TRINITY_DN1960_c0_g1_i1.p1 TRINITY_DN1960_c0_g1~~TRINITY_DN1960_c0_g1_i1.p1  ORF type:complete len:140 (+),score=44.82 TRINITY_DN1960_c0_g1_i1:106-525(+)
MAQGNFYFGLNETSIGLPVPKAIYERYKMVVGERNAEWFLLTGKLFVGEESKNVGLVDEIVTQDQLIPHCEKVMTNWINSTGYTVVRQTRNNIKKDLGDLFEFMRVNEKKAFLDFFFLEESRERFRILFENLKKKKKTE